MKSKTLVISLIVLAIIAILAFVISSKAIKEAPKDDVGIVLKHYDNINTTRYTEIFLMAGNGITKKLVGGVYNTLGLNFNDSIMDSSPQEILDAMDLDAMAKEFDVLSVFKNGPRLWTLDWIEVNTGAQRDFQGLKANWVMWLQVPKELINHESTAYKKIYGERDTQMGINAGTRVYLLDDPEGNTYCMKSAGLIVDPSQKYEDLQNLGSRLKPAEGWKWRTVVLEKDLVLTADNGKVTITQDELGNTYDRVGGPYSNYKP